MADWITRILKSLHPQWISKIVDPKRMNLNKMPYDEVTSNLIAFEKAHMKDQLQDTKKKIVAFKATNKEEDNDLDEDELALITRTVVGNYRRSKNQRR